MKISWRQWVAASPLLVLVLDGCSEADLNDLFAGGGATPAKTVQTFGQLDGDMVSGVPALAMKLEIDPTALPLRSPSTGTIKYMADLNGLSDCLVLRPTKRFSGVAKKPADGMPDPTALRVCLCNFDTSANKLRDAIKQIEIDVRGLSAAEAETAADDFLAHAGTAKEDDGIYLDVYAEPEVDGSTPWSELGEVVDNELIVAAYTWEDANDDDIDDATERTFVNPAPYLSQVSDLVAKVQQQSPEIENLIIQEADTEVGINSGTSHVYSFTASDPTPAIPTTSFIRLQLVLKSLDGSEGGAVGPTIVPYSIDYDLRHTVSGSRSRGISHFNTLDPDDDLAAIRDRVYGVLSSSASNEYWLYVPLDLDFPAVSTPTPEGILRTDLSTVADLSLSVDGVTVFEPGDYELDVTVTPAFGTPDSKTVQFSITSDPIARLTAANAADAEEEVPGAAVVLNDDNDNDNEYPDPSPVAGHNPVEVWWDLDETDTVSGEDDLMTLVVDVVPHTLAGNATLTIPSGAARIRLWTHEEKGAGNLVAVGGGLAIPIVDLPKTYYVEGIDTGTAEIELEYTDGATTYDDKVVINVVSLVHEQTWPVVLGGGTLPRVINRYGTDIDFEVDGGTAAYNYDWDLNGDGVYNTHLAETGSAARKTVRYDTVDSGTSVRLDRIVGNIRQEYEIRVRLTGDVVLLRIIRVALDANYGVALAAATTPTRQVEVAGLGAAPAGMDAVPGGGAGTTYSQAWHVANFGITLGINAGNRLQYAPLLGANGATVHNGAVAGLTSADREVYVVMIGTGPYSLPLQMQEDATLSLNHENVHVAQWQAIRDNVPAANVWRLLDTHFGVSGGFSDFRETEGHLSEVIDPTVSWFHLIDGGQQDLGAAVARYTAAVGVLAVIPAGATATAARDQLQEWYGAFPFDDAKRGTFDESITPPP